MEETWISHVHLYKSLKHKQSFGLHLAFNLFIPKELLDHLNVTYFRDAKVLSAVFDFSEAWGLKAKYGQFWQIMDKFRHSIFTKYPGGMNDPT